MAVVSCRCWRWPEAGCSCGPKPGHWSRGVCRGLHTALHGFGLLGLCRGPHWPRSVAEATRFVDACGRDLHVGAVALYLGWIFFYVTVGRLSLEWEAAARPPALFESMVFDNKIATPLLSQAGLEEFGLFSALSGVPLLATGRCYRAVERHWLPTILYALPGLFFLGDGGRRARRSTSISCCRSSRVSLPRAGWSHPPAERRCAPSSCSPAYTCSSGRLSAAESLPGWRWRHDALRKLNSTVPF